MERERVTLKDAIPLACPNCGQLPRIGSNPYTWWAECISDDERCNAETGHDELETIRKWNSSVARVNHDDHP